MAYDWRAQKRLEASFPLHNKDLRCPKCNAKMRLKEGKYGIFYGCPNWSKTGCLGVFKCNQNTAEIDPLDLDPEVREFRERICQMFKDKIQPRAKSKFIDSLHKRLGIPRENCKLKLLNLEQCKETLNLIEAFLGKQSRFSRILLQLEEDSPTP